MPRHDARASRALSQSGIAASRHGLSRTHRYVRCQLHTDTDRNRMKTGLVLGAGGATAWVFHAAVLATVEEELGLAGNDFTAIVGTSAGASLAVALRVGVAPDEFVEIVSKPPTQEDREAMLSEMRASKKTIVPLAPHLAREMLPGGRGVTFALAGLLPPGLFPTDWISSLPGIAGLEQWPAGLWIPATRAADGTTVVFGKDRRDVSVSAAVRASSAVPGMFRPQLIDGEAFIDGGVASSTHADLLADAGIERAIISAPMSKPSLRPFSRNAVRRLSSEAALLRASGIKTISISPSADISSAARGYPRRRPEARPQIAQHAIRATRLALAVP